MVKPLEKSSDGIGKSFLPDNSYSNDYYFIELGTKDLNEQGKDCYYKNAHLLLKDFKVSYRTKTIYDIIVFYDPQSKKVQIIKHRGLPAYADLIKFPDVWEDPRYTINI